MLLFLIARNLLGSYNQLSENLMLALCLLSAHSTLAGNLTTSPLPPPYSVSKLVIIYQSEPPPLGCAAIYCYLSELFVSVANLGENTAENYSQRSFLGGPFFFLLKALVWKVGKANSEQFFSFVFLRVLKKKTNVLKLEQMS